MNPLEELIFWLKRDKRLPEPGEVWELVRTEEKDPFDNVDYTVKILETRKGWVKYQIGEGLGGDSTMPQRRFALYYRYHSKP